MESGAPMLSLALTLRGRTRPIRKSIDRCETLLQLTSTYLRQYAGKFSRLAPYLSSRLACPKAGC